MNPFFLFLLVLTGTLFGDRVVHFSVATHTVLVFFSSVLRSDVPNIYHLLQRN